MIDLSKSIVIREDGVVKNLNDVRKLNTKNAGGGASNWIPEDETEVGTLTITSNGEFAAVSDGLYGYNRVVVLVPGGGDCEIDGKTINVPSGGIGSSIIGTVDGTQCRISVDSNGYLVTEVL